MEWETHSLVDKLFDDKVAKPTHKKAWHPLHQLITLHERKTVKNKILFRRAAFHVLSRDIKPLSKTMQKERVRLI